MNYLRHPACPACLSTKKLGPRRLGGITITLCAECASKIRSHWSLNHGDKIREALAKRKAAGKHVGAPRTVSGDAEKVERVLALRAAGLTLRQIVEATKIPHNTVARICRAGKAVA